MPERSVYAVIDTNVLVSALLKPGSVPGRVVDHAFGGNLVPVVSNDIEREYLEVLYRAKFKFDHATVRTFLSALADVSVRRLPAALDADTEGLPDPKDVVFYAVSLSARADLDAWLVTGNAKHFPQEPFVVSPREMLGILEGKASETA